MHFESNKLADSRESTLRERMTSVSTQQELVEAVLSLGDLHEGKVQNSSGEWDDVNSLVEAIREGRLFALLKHPELYSAVQKGFSADTYQNETDLEHVEMNESELWDKIDGSTTREELITFVEALASFHNEQIEGSVRGNWLHAKDITDAIRDGRGHLVAHSRIQRASMNIYDYYEKQASSETDAPLSENDLSQAGGLVEQTTENDSDTIDMSGDLPAEPESVPFEGKIDGVVDEPVPYDESSVEDMSETSPSLVSESVDDDTSRDIPSHDAVTTLASEEVPESDVREESEMDAEESQPSASPEGATNEPEERLEDEVSREMSDFQVESFENVVGLLPEFQEYPSLRESVKDANALDTEIAMYRYGYEVLNRDGFLKLLKKENAPFRFAQILTGDSRFTSKFFGDRPRFLQLTSPDIADIAETLISPEYVNQLVEQDGITEDMLETIIQSTTLSPREKAKATLTILDAYEARGN